MAHVVSMSAVTCVSMYSTDIPYMNDIIIIIGIRVYMLHYMNSTWEQTTALPACLGSALDSAQLDQIAHTIVTTSPYSTLERQSTSPYSATDTASPNYANPASVGQMLQVVLTCLSVSESTR